MNKEEIKEMCKLQHKDFVYKLLINRMPIAYTNYDMGKMEHDMKIRSDYEENKTKMYKKVEEIGINKIKDTFGNQEIIKKQENRFTYDDQRKASKEILGKELTLEEVIEYLK